MFEQVFWHYGPAKGTQKVHYNLGLCYLKLKALLIPNGL
jgi:hypothetical protein